MRILVALGVAAVLLAAPASADDNSYLNDITAPRTVHPPVSKADLLIDGREVCFHESATRSKWTATRTAPVRPLSVGTWFHRGLARKRIRASAVA
jgi:hypothetical protein